MRRVASSPESPKALADRTLNALRRRFERWELDHLRAHSAELQDRLERAEEEAARAWDSAEFWQRNAMELQEELLSEGFGIGLTKEGQMVAIKEPQSCAS